MYPRAAYLSLYLIWVSSLGLWSSPASAAQEVTLAISASTMEAALREFSKQTGLDVVFRKEDVGGMRNKAVHGRYSRESALKRLIGKNHLCVHFAEDQTWVTVDLCGRDEGGVEP